MLPRQTRILVVEDEFLVALDLTRRLTRLGYQVVGPVAISYAMTRRPDLIFMDIHLQGLIPIIYLSALTDAPTRARIRTHGAATALRKPIATAVLQQTLTQVLAAARSVPP